MSEPHSGEPIVIAKAIDKSFPGVQALRDVDFEVCAGEVHALVGENGAGKSTLIKIISGALAPDDGVVIVEGERVTHFDPTLAYRHRMGVVHQHFSLIPPLSVAENLFLGRLPRARTGVVDWPNLYRNAEEVLAVLKADVDVHRLVRALTTAEKQMVEVAKAFAQKIRILILDEPTSALTETEKDRLFETVRTFVSRGGAVIYISHRLDEVFEIADRVTILRDGIRVGTFPLEEIDRDSAVKMVVGRELLDLRKRRTEISNDRREILRVENLGARGTLLKGIDLTLHEGEVLGIAGPLGSGRSELLRSLFGLISLTSGKIYLRGHQVSISSPRDAIGHGIGFLGEDRKESLILCLAVAYNITLASLRQVFERGLLNRKREKELAERYVERLDIRTPSLWQRVQLLSGGNQQKVLLARWLCSEVDILLLDEPVLGIDVGAKDEVTRILRELAERGISIIAVSSEIPNLIDMADRILVMRSGSIVAEFEADRAGQEKIVRAILEEKAQALESHRAEPKARR